ncbi:MAG: 6-phospho-3-hexuloisomerase [Acidobacteriaceae bacterium]|nr:6-phospho-3-hexuloisomerase [Acidobacteriaceae bacterium]
MQNTQTEFTATSTLLLEEVQKTLLQVNAEEAGRAATMLQQANRVFFLGAGRSGLALKMAAMRMMHLGLMVYVAGEVVTPAIASGDLLVVASGSGTTAGPVHAAEIARKAGASVLALTASAESALGLLANSVVVIPAATKQGNDGTISQQYAGALFEQTLLLVMDALFQNLWHQRGETAEELWKRHANLE